MRSLRTNKRIAAMLAPVLSISALAGARAETRLSEAPSTTFNSLRAYINKVVVVVVRDGAQTRGRLVDVRDTDLVLDVDGSSHTLAAANIQTVAVRESSWKKGATIGAGIGVIIAGVGIAAVDRPKSGSGKLAVAAIGVASYAALGALLGSLAHHDTVVFRSERPPA